MHRVFQAFVDRLFESSSLDDLRVARIETAQALNLPCFAYLSLSQSPRAAPVKERQK